MLIKFNPIKRSLCQLGLGICLLLGQPHSYAEKLQGIHEYQVKAIFLLNFCKFVTYPEEAFSNTGSEMNLCVLGDDPFQGSLDTLVKGEKVQGRPVTVNYIRDIEKTSECHTLFVSQSEEKKMASIIAYLRNKPILTVSDITNFVTHGGMIQFYILDSKVRFFIDPVTAREANIRVSSRLLQVASIVDKGAKKE